VVVTSLKRRLFLLLLGLAGCAQPPPVAGAACPCGSQDFVCQDGVCVKATPVTPVTPVACADPGPAGPHRLSAGEYRNTVLDLLGVDMGGNVLSDQPLPTAPPDSALAPPVPVEFQDLAMLVGSLVGPTVEGLVSCAGLSTAGCGRRFVEGFGRRAFRHTLKDDERALLQARFDGAGADLRAGLLAVVTGALQAPQFVYRIETGEPRQGTARTVPLTAFERASRLSYFLWQSMPDDQLLAAAESGALRDPDQVAIQARRLLGDPRAGRAIARFHRQWLQLDLSQATELPEQLRASLMASADDFFTTVAWQEDQPIANLLTFPSVYGDRSMAAFYDLTPPGGDGLEALAPRGDQIRRGILTTPALLATYSHGAVSAPVRRGRLISERVLCRPVPPQPPTTPKAPPIGTMTTRQTLSQHQENPACRACHDLFDPIGFGLENYDGYGRWRTEENGQAVDASGVVLGTPFQGPDGLARYLAEPERAPHCLVVQWFRQALGRMDQDVDDCTMGALQAAFLRGQMRTSALVMAIAGSNAFLTRRALPAP
jgi:hypothetical protein